MTDLSEEGYDACLCIKRFVVRVAWSNMLQYAIIASTHSNEREKESNLRFSFDQSSFEIFWSTP